MASSSGNEAAQAESVIPSYCICPVTLEIMRDPVIVDAPCKHTCSRQAMERWLAAASEEAANTCPICGTKLASSLLSPNSMVCDAIDSTIGKDDQIPIRFALLTGLKRTCRASKHARWKEVVTQALCHPSSSHTDYRVLYHGRELCPEARVDGIGFSDTDIEKNVCHAILQLGCGGLTPSATVIQSIVYRLGTRRNIGWGQQGFCNLSFSPQCPKTRYGKRADLKCQWCGCLPYRKLQVEKRDLTWTRLGSSELLSIDIGLKRMSFPEGPDIFWLDFDDFHPPDGTLKVIKVGSGGGGEEILGSLRGPSDEGSWDSFAVPTITWTAEKPFDCTGDYLVRLQEERLPWQGDPGRLIGLSEWSFRLV